MAERSYVAAALAAGPNRTAAAVTLAIALAVAALGRIPLAAGMQSEVDLRRPSLSEMLSVSGRFGLSHLLTRDLPLNKAVYDTPIPKLQYIPAGDPAENPAELLGSKQMEDLLDVLRAEYDFVVLDTPPILYVHDAGILSSSVDGIVYVIKLGVTPRDRVTRGLEILSAMRSPSADPRPLAPHDAMS